MWGPILASVLDAANRVSATEAARIEADLLDPMPHQRADPLRNEEFEVVTGLPDMPAIAAATLPVPDDAALDRLESLTHYHRLSNPTTGTGR